MHRKFRGELFTVLALPFLVTMMVIAARFVYLQPSSLDVVATTYAASPVA